DMEGNPMPDEKLPFAQTLHSGKPVDDIRYGLEKSDGTRIFISANAEPIKDEKGQINEVLIAVTDITEQVKAQEKIKEARNTYKKLFDHLLDEVHLWKVLKDEKGEIEGWELIDANPTAVKAWGKSREEVIGKSPNEIFQTDAYGQFLPLVKKIFDTGNPYTWEEYFAPTDQYLSMASIPLDEAFISTGRDITKQKQDEKKILEAKEKAEEASRLKSEFLKNMSHEIRTPMNGIIGFSDLLNKPDLKKDEIEQYTTIIRNSSLQLLRTIDDILEISTLESQKNTIVESAFSLNELLAELHSVFNLESKTRNILIHLNKTLSDEESTIVSDRSKLYKIMRNLMENALKFTHEGAVELGYQIEGTQLILHVKDTGIGIAQKNIRTIFDRFSQEDMELSKKSYGGLGLGLSISMESVKLLGGDITVESEKGMGSVFRVSIPYQKPA
ncbi:MAG: PAS domain-containing sensor histidine kinase, partial [Cryomorphaceae bacterium]